MMDNHTYEAAMDGAIERLNHQIDLMQAGRSPFSECGRSPGEEFSPEECAILKMALLLNSLRPGAGQPDQQFLARLRSEMLEEAPA